MQYLNINQAVVTSELLARGEMKIHYANSSVVMDSTQKDTIPYRILTKSRFGIDKLREEYDNSTENVLRDNIHVTHTCIGSIKGGEKEDVFIALQGENWSPNGEARTLIRELGADHTSMSSGDIIETSDGFYVVSFIGFEKV